MKLGQIKAANQNIDHTKRIVLAYPIFQAFRKQCDLLAIHSVNGLGQSYSQLAGPIACSTAATGRQRVNALAKSRKRGKRILALVVRGLQGRRIGLGDCGRGPTAAGSGRRRIALCCRDRCLTVAVRIC
jgi:hypothetical protein